MFSSSASWEVDCKVVDDSEGESRAGKQKPETVPWDQCVPQCRTVQSWTNKKEKRKKHKTQDKKQKTENTYNYTKARNRSLRPMRSTKCRRVQKNAKQCNVEQTKRKRYKKHKQLQCQNHFPEINAFYTVAAHCIANTMQNTNTNIYNIQKYKYLLIQ